VRKPRYLFALLPLALGAFTYIAGEITLGVIYSTGGFVGLVVNFCTDHIVSAIRENKKKESP